MRNSTIFTEEQNPIYNQLHSFYTHSKKLLCCQDLSLHHRLICHEVQTPNFVYILILSIFVLRNALKTILYQNRMCFFQVINNDIRISH